MNHRLFPLVGTTFDYDMTKDDWTLIQNSTRPKKICVSCLELSSPAADNEPRSFFNKKSRRCLKISKGFGKKIKNALGQKHAELLIKNQKHIPNEWREFTLLFPGTNWRSGETFLVPAISFNLKSKCWKLCFEDLNEVWYLFEKFVRGLKVIHV